MAKSQIKGVAIRGIVCAVPGAPVRVEDAGARLAAADVARAKKAVGLNQMHRVGNATACDLCVAAARSLISDVGWPPESVDAIIFVTQQPDHFLPANACLAHGRLGLSDKAAAFDIAMGCSGYVYGLMTAASFIAGGGLARILVLAGDTVSRVCSPLDKSTALLFGDAGTATAVEHDAQAPALSFECGTDGSGADRLIIPAGGFRQPADDAARTRRPDAEGNLRAATELYMDGLAVFAFSLRRVPPLIANVLALHGWKADDCERYLFHQANGFMLKTLAKKLGVPSERVPTNIARYGNTSSASIPLLIADDLSAELRGGRLRTLLAGFGVGFSWAAMAGEIGPLTTARVVQTEA